MRTKNLCGLCVFCGVVFSVVVSAADWPQWRGVNRDGHSPETGLLVPWPAGGPRVVWRASGLGEGYSSMSVAGGRVYTQGQRGNMEFVVALDVKTGAKLWETTTGRAFRESRGNGPRGTPTVDGDRVYALAAAVRSCVWMAPRASHGGFKTSSRSTAALLFPGG